MHSHLPERVIKFSGKTKFYPNEPYYYRIGGPVLTPDEIIENAAIKMDLYQDLIKITKQPEPRRTTNLETRSKELFSLFNRIYVDYYENCVWLALFRKGEKSADRDPANNVFTAMSLNFTQLTVITGKLKFINQQQVQQTLF